jgi:hypothetical protein
MIQRMTHRTHRSAGLTGVDSDIASILDCCIWNWRFCRVASVWL